MAKGTRSATSTPSSKQAVSTTPKSKSKVTTPKSAPPAVTLPVEEPALEHDDKNTPEADAESDTEAVTATPSARTPKRKAPQDGLTSAPASSSSKKSKKPRVASHTTEATFTSSAGKKSSLKRSDIQAEIPISAPATGKHIRFDDDDGDDDDGGKGPSEFYTPLEGSARNALDARLAGGKAEEEGREEEAEEDSDDEAPEAVSTSTSAAQAAKSAEAAARAAEQQQEELRRRRQERDARLKKQTEERRKTKQQATAARAQAQAQTQADAPAPAGESHHSHHRLPDISTATTSSRKRLDRRTNLPAVLPDEFLASDSEADDDDDDDDDDNAAASRPRKIKFNTAARQVTRSEARRPVDQRLGDAVYRVMKKQGDGKLAPKGGKYSRNARDMLLARGRTGGVSGARKGFLVRR